MAEINSKKPIKYYDSNTSMELKNNLIINNQKLVAEQQILNEAIDNLTEKYLQLGKSGQLHSLRDIKPLLKANSKLTRVTNRLIRNNQLIDKLSAGKLEIESIIIKLLKIFRKKEKLTIFYSDKESEVLKFIYNNKINSSEEKLKVQTEKYLNLGNKVSGFDEFRSLDPEIVKAKQAKLLKKLARTKDDLKASKIEKRYHNLSVNKFEPRFKFIKNILKKSYVNKLFKLSKKDDRLKAKIQKYKVYLVRLESKSLEKLNIFQSFNKAFTSLNYKQQKVIFGILFILPWFIGFCIFFASPLISTIWWSLNDMVVKEGGGFNFSYVGIGNYRNLFTNVTLSGITFPEMLTTAILNLTINLPVIIIFSLFIAVLLNKKFKGHQIVKAIFFIPVVFNMSVINNTLNGVFGQLLSSDVGEGFALSGQFADFLFRIGIGNDLVEFLTGAVDRIFTIVNMSGIQILIFLAALQSIPSHLYEAAKVEGATQYEMFWKITIPMVSPMILTTVVYTVVDSFATSNIIQFMTVNSQGTTMATTQPGLYSAISIIFFLANALIIVFVFGLLKRVVFYYDE